MQSIFAFSYGNEKLGGPDYDEIVKNLPEIDKLVAENAPKWPLDKINKIDLSILRCAFWELLYQKNSPPRVVIDEAIELAKEFGTESSASFVNGVIGTAIKQIPIKIQDET